MGLSPHKIRDDRLLVLEVFRKLREVDCLQPATPPADRIQVIA